mgnify:CR=1 FL=1
MNWAFVAAPVKFLCYEVLSSYLLMCVSLYFHLGCKALLLRADIQA